MLTCGTSDPFIAANRALAGRLADVEPTFDAGGHDTDYWRSHAGAQVDWLADSCAEVRALTGGSQTRRVGLSDADWVRRERSQRLSSPRVEGVIVSQQSRRPQPPVVPLHPTEAPAEDVGPTDVDQRSVRSRAAGLTAIAVTAQRGMEQMGARRACAPCAGSTRPTASTAWAARGPTRDPESAASPSSARTAPRPSPRRRRCDRVDPSFFADHPGRRARRLDRLPARPAGPPHRTRWCCATGGTHYEPISWDDAFALIAEHAARRSTSPDEAVFYTSGRASNEAAFAYQLFARAFGTNNLPDCSNMCHESTSVALAETIGIGKGSVSLDDIHEAELIVIAGQNPGTNHPRMLTALEKAKRAAPTSSPSTRCPRPGLRGFDNPQTVRGLIGVGTELADEFLPIRLGGDLALFQAIGSLLVARTTRAQDVSTSTSSSATPTGFEDVGRALRDLDWDARRARPPGSPAPRSSASPSSSRASRRTVICWAMGITQHRNAVATIKEITNVALLQGNIGKPGAGLCPVRGHSNVQGDRTMGIWEKLPAHFARRARARVRLRPAARARPRRRQHDPRHARRRGAGPLRARRQLRRGDARHRGDPRRDARRSTSTCRSRPSSTARTSLPGRHAR